MDRLVSNVARDATNAEMRVATLSMQLEEANKEIVSLKEKLPKAEVVQIDGAA